MKHILSLGLMSVLSMGFAGGAAMAESAQCAGRVYAGNPVLSVTESGDQVLLEAYGVGLWGRYEDPFPAFEFVAKDGKTVFIMANDSVEGLFVKFNKSECVKDGENWFCQAKNRDMRTIFRSVNDLSLGRIDATVALNHVAFTFTEESASFSLVSPNASGKVAVRSIAFFCR